MSAPILKYFAWQHLPAKLQTVSQPIGELALQLDGLLPDGPEKSTAMRKLLEAKDCAVRAALEVAHIDESVASADPCPQCPSGRTCPIHWCGRARLAGAASRGASA